MKVFKRFVQELIPSKWLSLTAMILGIAIISLASFTLQGRALLFTLTVGALLLLITWGKTAFGQIVEKGSVPFFL